MLSRRYIVSLTFFAFVMLVAVFPGSMFPQSQPQILPTGMSITPLAPHSYTQESTQRNIYRIPIP
jgi:hypothetical protein